jgi:phage gpG-like protein
MSVRGDFGKLRKVQLQVDGLRKPAFRAGLSKALAAEAIELVDDGFATSTDPNGQAWDPQHSRPGGQTLRDTARLQRSFTVSINTSGFSIGSNVRYAKSHQDGITIRAKNAPYLRFRMNGKWVSRKEVTLPQRMMVPEGELGPKWTAAFREASRDYFDDHFR